MSEHSNWTGYAASYALGALDADELTGFEQHLAGCDECMAEVKEYREVAATLAHGVPYASPPTALKERILTEARAVRPIRRPTERAGVLDRAIRGGPAWTALAAGLALAIGATAWFIERDRRLDAELALTDATTLLDERSAELARVDSALLQRDSLLATILAEDVRTVTLTSQGTPPSARMFWNAGRGSIVLTAYDLPPAAAGRTYQLWGISGGQPISLGTFNTSPAGPTTVELRVDPSLRFEVGAVTDEPAGGSPQPTTTPFLVGTLTTE